MASFDHGQQRWPGLLCLGLAGLMLLLGLTALESQLQGLGFLIYWSFCFLLTLAALCIAALQLRSIRRRVKMEHRELIKQTLERMPGDNTKNTGDRAPP